MCAMLTERYQDCLAGVLSCYDRIVITGTLPGVTTIPHPIEPDSSEATSLWRKFELHALSPS
jgi:hypothetical protein